MLTTTTTVPFCISQSQMEIFNYIDTVIVFVVPFTIIVVLNSVTSFTVWRFAGLRRNMTLPKRKPSNLEIRRQLSFQYFSTHPNGRNGILRRTSMSMGRGALFYGRTIH
uniref:Uncharacterized protein n=1 Tax=Anopheles maculatus TaxID=74869 RepID=A0A182SJF0_9DIPT